MLRSANGRALVQLLRPPCPDLPSPLSPVACCRALERRRRLLAPPVRPTRRRPPAGSRPPPALPLLQMASLPQPPRNGASGLPTRAPWCDRGGGSCADRLRLLRSLRPPTAPRP